MEKHRVGADVTVLSDYAEVPTVFRITADPSFGALISFGIGGVATELLDDRAYRAVPLTDADAADLIGAPRAAPLLNGYRGTRVVPREPRKSAGSWYPEILAAGTA